MTTLHYLTKPVADLLYEALGGVAVLGAATELTISSGAITVTGNYHIVDTEADAASDDLDTINGGSDGDLLMLQTADNTRDVTVKDLTGNINLAEDVVLLNKASKLLLIYNGATSQWNEVVRLPSVLDEDDFTSDSALLPPSQQSAKAYIDSLLQITPQHITYTHTGDLTTGPLPFEWVTPFDLNLVGLQARAGTAPVGSAATFDVHDDGTTAFTTKASIPDGDKGGASQAPSTAFVAAGSVITFEVDSKGSTTPGADVLITLEYTPAASVAPGTQPFVFSVMEQLVTGARPFEWPVPFDCTIEWIQVTAGDAPTTTSIISDWRKGATPVTLFTTSANRPEIATATKASAQEVPDITALSAGDILTWDIVQKDSADVGRYLTTTIKVTVP